MKIVFLESTRRDIQWFRFYYGAILPDGSARARRQLKSMQAVLSANPFAGRRSVSHPEVRELSIPRTPFTLIYRVMPTQIEILRLWDNRQGTDF